MKFSEIIRLLIGVIALIVGITYLIVTWDDERPASTTAETTVVTEQ